MSEHFLFLTGKLAERSLERTLGELHPRPFSYEIVNLGVNVAALMTADMIDRRLADSRGASRIIVPGLCAGDLNKPATRLGVPVERGPKDLKDLPQFFGNKKKAVDLSRYDVRIFAEIVEAPQLDIDGILAAAAAYASDGADVIDVGCLPGQPFPHLEDAVRALKSAGYRVSVDSIDPEELSRGARAGADYLLSLKESTLALATEVEAIPVLIPESAGDIPSLYRAIDRLTALGKPFIADSILDPIHFGFTESIVRYRDLRQHYPDIEIMMGTGNLSELTDADTSGMNALMLGIMSELEIKNLLATQVSKHARCVVRELNIGRRVMFAAKEDNALPRGYDPGLMVAHDKRPFPYSLAEIHELATAIRDPSYRVQVSEDGMHVFNRDGFWSGTDPFALFPQLRELAQDAPHAFYMGAELAKAQIAWQLGKRYEQDVVLNWNSGGRTLADGDAVAVHEFKPTGTTMTTKRARKADPQ